MRGLSKDLRERIVRRYASLKDASEVAAQFEVSERSVYRYVKLEREGESLEPSRPPGQQSIVERKGLAEIVRQLVKEDSEASLKTYCERLEEKTGIVMSPPSMCRALQKLELPRKKRPSNPKSVTRLAD